MTEMPASGDRALMAPWVVRSLLAEVANKASAMLRGSADDVPRDYEGLLLTRPGHQFLAYWSEARGDKMIPYADEINPAHISELLPYTRYMHWDGDRLVHRLVGSALVQAMGIDLTDMDLFDFVRPEVRDRERESLRLLHARPCGLVVVTESVDRSGGKILAEMSFLPVAGGDGRPDRLVGTIMSRTPFGRSEVANMPEPNARMVSSVRARLYLDIGAGVPSPDPDQPG